MKRAIRVKLYPTPEQEVLMYQSCGVARKAYNLCKALDIQFYENTGKGIPSKDFGPMMTQIRRGDDFPYMKLVSADVPKQAVKDYLMARDRSIKTFGNGHHINWKTKKSGLTFYADYVKTKVRRKHVYISMIGDIKTSRQLPRNVKLGNPRVTHDGLDWWLSIVIDTPNLPQEELTDDVLGIDLGLLNLVTTSTGDTYENITKSEFWVELDKKSRRYQRAMSRKVKGSKKYKQTKERFLKCEQKKANIRKNWHYHVVNSLVKTKPRKIVMEVLGIKDMLKNHRMARSIQNTAWYSFQQILIYKAVAMGIEVVKADRYYPSSQICSDCGMRQSMPLSERVFNCHSCGFSCDRDINAALNLANY